MGPILITGAGGVLGLALAGAAAPGGPWRIAGRRRPAFWPAAVPFDSLDLATAGALGELVRRLRPRAVLHAAAVTKVAEAEADPAACERVNVAAVAELVEAAEVCGAAVVLVSTDMVFDGHGGPYTEADPVDAVSVYGRTKAAGEAVLLPAGHTVARVPLLLGGDAGPGRRGADSALLAALAAGERPALFRDEMRVPVAAELAAEALVELVRRAARGDAPGGVFHLVGGEAVDRHTLGRRICAAAGVAPAFDAASVAELAPARPRRLVLGCERARRELGWEAPDLRQSLARRFPTAP